MTTEENSKTMIIQEFLKLPPIIAFEGIEFTPQIINDGGNEARLVYKIESVADNSPHKADIDTYNCWNNKLADPNKPPSQGFLKLYEGIYDDVDLIWAIRDCWLWLGINGLLTKQENSCKDEERG